MTPHEINYPSSFTPSHISELARCIKEVFGFIGMTYINQITLLSQNISPINPARISNTHPRILTILGEEFEGSHF